MIVAIAEKPSVARDIARILGATSQRGGYMEGNGYQVTWTYGHLCTLKEPHDYQPSWKYWSLGSLPMIPPRFGIKVIDEEHITRQFAVVEQLFRNADSIINCGDAGQEGELIQRWVMQKAGARCPVKRLWISSMTDEAIREGFANLKDQDDYQPLYYAGLSRAVGDWLLGMNATRLYTIKYGSNRQVLSIGRVQTPTLALIVNRQKEIREFKPEPYWVLSTIYRDTLFTATAGRFTSEEEGKAAFALIEGKPFTITKVEKKDGTEPPPKLYDLTSLQVDCNRKFGMSAEQTLNTIQTLYERKLTTYPRVDTTYLPDDVYPKCAQTLASMTPYAPLIAPLNLQKLPKSKKVFDNSKVTDHHAIIPTGVNPANANLALHEKRVYDLVARRFISVFYPNCKFATTTVLGEVQSAECRVQSLEEVQSAECRVQSLEEVQSAECRVQSASAQPDSALCTLHSALSFKATGKMILDPGWRAVYPQKPKAKTAEQDNADTADGSVNTDSAEEKVLPNFVVGESGDHQPTLARKETKAPPYYTEASLLRAMETAGKFVENEELRAAMKENGIGRPSSRAGIIETLFKRKYIIRHGKRLEATDMGIQLIGLIKEELLKSCELTGIWEKKLRDIERRQYDAGAFISELKEQITEIVRQVLADNTPRRLGG